MPELAYIYGRFCAIEEAAVPIEDRGFQFGDGVYEVVVAYGGRLFLLDRHMKRLRGSAAGIGLEYDFEGAALEPIIEEGLARSGFSDAMVYVQLTRGVAPRSHVIPKGTAPTVVMTFKALPELPEGLRERGLKLMTTPDTRWAKCYIKAVTLLPNVLARNEAMRQGYDDALFVGTDGEVRECTSANVFVARGGALAFPPLTESVLHGVTQGYLVECARAIGVACKEERVGIEALHDADEVFVSGTTMEVVGVTSIDGRRIGNGDVGPLTQRLWNEFLARSRREMGGG